MSRNLDNDIKYVLVNAEEIQEITKKLGKQISQDYAGKDLVVIGMLKGATPFMMDLLKSITLPVTIDFIQISSYHGGTHSTNAIIFKKDIDTDVRGKHVLIVDDIVDTAKTIKKVLNIFEDRGVESIELCCLLDKPEGRVVDYEPKYAGKVIPNEFVVGYGLDFNEYYRNLPYVGVVKEEMYK